MLTDKDKYNDILIELSNDEVENFRLFYKNLKQIEFVYVHLYLKNQLRWNALMIQLREDEVNEISDRCKMRFYRHRHGADECKTIVGITGDKEYNIFVMTLEESLNELRECLYRSKYIKWDLLPLCVAVHQRFHKMMYEIFKVKNLRVRFDNRCSCIWMNKEKALSYESTVPNNVELKKLNVSDYQIVNEAWRYKYPGSECFIKSLIQLNGGLGLYQNGKLISWILQTECFGIGSLQTIKEHQGKGYARLLTRVMTKQISEIYNEDIILFASHDKPKTVDMYIRYEYQHVSFTHWFRLE